MSLKSRSSSLLGEERTCSCSGGSSVTSCSFQERGRISAHRSDAAQKCSWSANKAHQHTEEFLWYSLLCFTLLAPFTISDLFGNSHNLLFNVINGRLIQKGSNFSNLGSVCSEWISPQTQTSQNCGFKHLDYSAHCRETSVTSQNPPVCPLKTWTNNFNLWIKNGSQK